MVGFPLERGVRENLQEKCLSLPKQRIFKDSDTKNRGFHGCLYVPGILSGQLRFIATAGGAEAGAG